MYTARGPWGSPTLCPWRDTQFASKLWPVSARESCPASPPQGPSRCSSLGVLQCLPRPRKLFLLLARRPCASAYDPSPRLGSSLVHTTTPNLPHAEPRPLSEQTQLGMRPQTCPVINPSRGFISSSQWEEKQHPESQGCPHSKRTSLPLQRCSSVLPLRNPHSPIFRCSPRPSGPKLLKFKKAAFVLLGTSSLRQNSSDSVTVSIISTHH